MSHLAGRPRGDRLLAVIAVACIGMQFPGTLPLSLTALATWMAAVAWLDRPVLRRMWMPRFWAITLVLALGTGFLLGRPDLDLWGIPLSTGGLTAGGLMIARGALILGLTSWAARAMTAGRLRRALSAVGLEPLGGAAAVAVGLLPEMQGRLREIAQAQSGIGTNGRFFRLREVAVAGFCETLLLAERIAAGKGPGRRARIAAVVGAPGEGKTTTVLRMAQRLREAGLRVGGVVQPGWTDGVRTGYALLDLATGWTRSFAILVPDPPPGGPRFRFDDAGWAWAADRIREARRTADVVVVDEIGRIEAAGGGHLLALRAVIWDERAGWWLLSVRADGADAVEQEVGGFEVRMDLAPGDDERSADVQAMVARMVDTVSNQKVGRWARDSQAATPSAP